MQEHEERTNENAEFVAQYTQKIFDELIQAWGGDDGEENFH